MSVYEGIQKDFKGEVSIADLIVLGECWSIEKAAKELDMISLFILLKEEEMHLKNKQILASFGYLEPLADGFRNYMKAGLNVAAEDLLIDRANLLSLIYS